ncbi:ROK family protein [Cryobacterium psychrophilum]|uniref:ROK family protein n=1 Tax=Cryobacterium psychrophilum TaxID=41988 RepID=A0A4Y8KQH1_9MICO|nr:ROK family protein [Cryobacterium psychrophilum]TDW29481.1 putative NBD/HSP70 family sugar kinase [Cryobacterium psychrophilum]TFD81385.1 ROK family protein [Cryobacterium psychrophilum]
MELTATGPQLLRRTNMTAILRHMRGTGVVTGSDLMGHTGLTRATVIAVCDDLIRLGWVQEIESHRFSSDNIRGRPARRFQFNHAAGAVVGIDVGAAKTTVLVADLMGRPLGKAMETFGAFEASTAERVATIDRALSEALESAGLTPSMILAVGVGVAAAVSRDGTISHGQGFWEAFDMGLQAELWQRYGWTVRIDNDANLAALAERWCGVGAGVDDLAVMLAGERIGTGLVENGRLLHGSAGGAGEAGSLELIAGVGTADGIARLARIWGTAALADGSPSTALTARGGPGGTVTAEMVFQAAAGGDAVASAILERIALRMARVVAMLGTMLNPTLVVIGGAVAASAGTLVATIERELPRWTATPPRVAVSTLGDTIVAVGAVRLALDYIEVNALDLDLAPA